MHPDHKPLSRPFARWSAPLLLSLLAACGGGGGGSADILILPGPQIPDRGSHAGTANADRNNASTGITGGTGATTGTRPGTSPAAPGASTGAGSAGGSAAGGGQRPQQPADSEPEIEIAVDDEQDNASNVGGASTGLRISTSGCRYYDGRQLTRVSGPDPELDKQWYLHNTGRVVNATPGVDLNLRPVWNRYKGKGIRVAVIDDALETTHEDLLPNIVVGASHNYLRLGRGNEHPLPCNAGQDHGTAVAGIIAARDDNGTGIRGIAPRAGLVGLNALASGTNVDILHAFAYNPQQTHIYNNSWGAPDDGHFYSPETGGSAFRQTLRTQLEKGRDGLGSIYVFAAGNGGHDGDYSAYDGHVTALGSLAICAHNAAGKRSFFSEPGPNLLVCAPSGDLDPASPKPAIFTTDIGNQYTDGFNGTSAAAPMASGVIALMLEANPRLSWRDVRLVLAHSARKIDAGNPGWTRHGKLHYNHEYGFGALDATAAVRLARSWQSVGGSQELRQCGPYRQSLAGTDALVPEVAPLDETAVKHILRKIDSRQIDLTRPLSGSLGSSIRIPDDCNISHIEHVDVVVDTTPATRGGNGSGDLQISLSSPAGQTSTLSTPHLCYEESGSDDDAFTVEDCTGLDDFRFGITRHMDEPAATASSRTWTLNAADRRVNGLRTRLEHWELTLYGR